MLVIGLAALFGLIAYQVRAIIASPFPVRRAVEALAISVPLFLLLFAATYAVLAALAHGSFDQPMNHTLRPSRRHRVTERALFRPVFEQRYGHVDDHARSGGPQS